MLLDSNGNVYINSHLLRLEGLFFSSQHLHISSSTNKQQPAQIQIAKPTFKMSDTYKPTGTHLSYAPLLSNPHNSHPQHTLSPSLSTLPLFSPLQPHPHFHLLPVCTDTQLKQSTTVSRKTAPPTSASAPANSPKAKSIPLKPVPQAERHLVEAETLVMSPALVEVVGRVVSVPSPR